jgi:hypothetical protein
LKGFRKNDGKDEGENNGDKDGGDPSGMSDAVGGEEG